jgi:hypothetical protein
MFNLDDYVIRVSLFIVNLRIFFLYFLKTQNDHANLFVNELNIPLLLLFFSLSNFLKNKNCNVIPLIKV